MACVVLRREPGGMWRRRGAGANLERPPGSGRTQAALPTTADFEVIGAPTQIR